MNFIAIIILLALVLTFVLDGLADFLNLRTLRDSIPESFREYYDTLSYSQSQAYLRTNTRFGWISAGVGLLFLLIFWFNRCFDLLDHWLRAWGHGPLITGLLFTGSLLLLKALLGLPFSVYATFVIEARFGFNQTTLQTFGLDRLKGLALALLLGGPLLLGVLAFFQYAGANAWWYCWLAVTVFMLGTQYLAPTWIMPLFNKFVPLEEGPLKTAILDYAGRIDFPLRNVMVMDGSRRSSKSNAFFTGFGKNRRIVLFDTLIERHATAELVAILAHEMGHYKCRHIPLMVALGILQTGAMFYLMSLIISRQVLFDAFYMQQTSTYAGLVFFGLLYTPIDVVTGIGIQMISRRNELAADRFAVGTTGNPQALAQALKKLSVHNLANLYPHPLYVFLNYSHPPILERIKAINDEGRKY